jgi:hypothetical protein
MEKWIKMSVGLGVLALTAVVTSHLALTDIYHGESDVTLEWRVVQVGFGVIVASQLTSLFTLTKLMRKRRQTVTEQDRTGARCSRPDLFS